MFYAEIFPNHLRARAMSLTIAVFGLTNLVYLQVAPIVSLLSSGAILNIGAIPAYTSHSIGL